MRKREISKSNKLKCVFCQGKGVQPGAERLSCIVCKGSGRITVKQPCSICKECGGRGKKASTNLYCLSCQGRGFVSSVSKTRRKRSKKSVKPKAKKVPTRTAGRGSSISRSEIGKKVEVKKEKKSFFKKFLETFKIL